MRGVRKKSGRVFPGDPGKKLIGEPQLGQHLQGGGLVGQGRVGTKEDIVGGVGFDQVAQADLVEKVEGKGDFHIDGFPGQQSADIGPFVPAAEVGGDQAQFGKTFDQVDNPLRVGPLHARIADIITGMHDQKQAKLCNPFIKVKEFGGIEEKILIIGMHFQTDKATIAYHFKLINPVRVGGMDGGQGDDTFRADAHGPVENGLELLWTGGDGADHGTFNAGPIHGGEQVGYGAVEVGLDIALFFQGLDGDRGDLVGKDMGVKVNVSSHRTSGVTTIPAHRDNEGMKAGVLETVMAGLSYKPAWLDQVGQPQQTMKICHFGMVAPVLCGDFRINQHGWTRLASHNKQ